LGGVSESEVVGRLSLRADLNQGADGVIVRVVCMLSLYSVIDYLFTGPTTSARPGCVEVPDVTLSFRLPTSSTGVAPSWHAERRAPPGGVWLKKGLFHSK